MLDLELSRPRQKTLERALAQSHPVRVKVTLRDQDEKPVSSLTVVEEPNKPHAIAGQVNVDSTADVPMQLQLDVLDPKAKLHLDSRSASDFAVHIDRFVSVSRGIYSDNFDWTSDGWIDVPIFWGVMNRPLSRTGDVVTIEALSKEVLYQPPNGLFHTVTLRKGTKVTTAIRNLMEPMGETRFDLPESDRRIRRDISVGRRQNVWRVVRKLADSTNRVARFDVRGRLCVKRHGENTAFIFRDGTEH